MPQINLTPEENNMLYGFIQGILEVVAEKPEMELPNKEHTTAVMTNVMRKVETEYNNQTTN
jgi:hypothetical protein